jgi:hypothetical protein
MFVSFNETTWWVFDKGTIDEVCVPMRGKGTAETCEEESETCFASGGCCWGAKIPPAAAWGWLAGCAAPPMERGKLAATVESMEEKRERGSAAKGGREKGVLMAEGSDTKLRIIRRLNLMVSQPFLYIYVGQYTIVMVEVTTQEYVYNISYIQYFLYKYIL